ncbi:MAG TPA: hypothetical protein VMG34_14820 [Bacteroidota bacterium]|nr:hypothetical protein [Bacteroidota bacterium]
MNRYCSSFLLLVAGLLSVFPLKTSAQTGASKASVRVVLVRGANPGMAPKDADLFYATLKGELGQFTSLSVYVRSDLERGLSAAERTEFERCVELGCLLSYARRAGMHYVLLCALTRKENNYRFQADLYDAAKSQRTSSFVHDALCASQEEMERFTKDVAVKVGEGITHDEEIPESLKEQGSNLWWYVGSAATVGVAAGVYFGVAHKKSTTPASPSSLPFPPDFP